MVGQKGATEADKVIGQRVRLHRTLRGLSQTELGSALGVTFQQVQKYEKGSNRIGSGRLLKVAEALGVSVGTFYEGIEGSGGDVPAEMITDKAGADLIRGYYAIRDPALRRTALEMVLALGRIPEGA